MLTCKKTVGACYCVAINCTNTRECGNPSLSLFTFPKDPQRCKQWILNTRRADLLDKTAEYAQKNLSLCALHFEDDQFMNAEQRKRLVWNAVPTLFHIPKTGYKSTKKIIQEEDNLNTDATDVRTVRCYAQNCRSVSTDRSPGVTFHEIPQNERMRNTWMVAIGRSDWKLKSGPWDYHVCSKHFRPREISTLGKTPKVKPNAVPSIFDNRQATTGSQTKRIRLDEPTSIEVEIETEGPNNDGLSLWLSSDNKRQNEVFEPPTYDQLHRRVQELESNAAKQSQQLKPLFQEDRLSGFLKLIEKAKAGDAGAVFLLDQVTNFSKKNPRWSDTAIRQSVALRDVSPQVYEEVRKLNLFKLPCLSTLCHYSETINNDSERSSFVIECLDFENSLQNGK